MSRGSTAMTQKQKPSLANGNHMYLHFRRRHGKVEATSRSCGQCFFYYQGVVHYEYAPQGQTVTKEYYIEVLRRLRDVVRRIWTQLWTSEDDSSP